MKRWLIAPLMVALLFVPTFIDQHLDQTGTINTMIDSIAPAVYCFDCRFQISLCNQLEIQKEVAEWQCNAFADIYGRDTTACREYDRLFYLVGQCWNSVDLNCNYPDI